MEISFEHNITIKEVQGTNIPTRTLLANFTASDTSTTFKSENYRVEQITMTALQASNKVIEDLFMYLNVDKSLCTFLYIYAQCKPESAVSKTNPATFDIGLLPDGGGVEVYFGNFSQYQLLNMKNWLHSFSIGNIQGIEDQSIVLTIIVGLNNE